MELGSRLNLGATWCRNWHWERSVSSFWWGYIEIFTHQSLASSFFVISKTVSFIRVTKYLFPGWVDHTIWQKFSKINLIFILLLHFVHFFFSLLRKSIHSLIKIVSRQLHFEWYRILILSHTHMVPPLNGIIIIWMWTLSKWLRLFSLYFWNISIEIRESCGEILLTKLELWMVVLMITCFISSVAWVSDELVDVMRLSSLKLWGLIFEIFCVYYGHIFESNESVIVGIANHASISSVEYFSLSLSFKFHWGVDICRDFVKVCIFAPLIVIFTGDNSWNSCWCISWFALQGTIQRGLVLFTVSSVIRTEQLICVFRNLNASWSTIYLACFISNFVRTTWQMLEPSRLSIELFVRWCF